MNEKKLTIVIPTYNRKKQLSEQLKRFAEYEIHKYASVFILDNCSDYDVESAIPKTIAKDVFLKKNSINVGLSANILRAFEFTDSGWLWILSDDDFAVENSIVKIFGLIESLKDVDKQCVALKYDSDLYGHFKNVDISNSNDLIQSENNYKYFSSLLLLSTWVFNVSFYKKIVSRAYSFLITYSPHLVLVIMCLDDSNKNYVRMSSEYIVEKDKREGLWDPAIVFPYLVHGYSIMPSSLSNESVLCLRSYCWQGSIKDVFFMYARMKYNGFSERVIKSLLYGERWYRSYLYLFSRLFMLFLNVVPERFKNRLFRHNKKSIWCERL
ncbi:glycosyltransferase family 2 protein [Prosthecochloris sp. SCSIO W1101]|uniref:glycosyltransferase family 2 protein n=1 Tax=Prosthecochloris sp. SCSIO W1101 TaxID=2992242 RepID=UPI00223DEBE6|nr:glycosyltransferase family 2 protein [Prosthecochloris sp. SCSIO W1101]UZJ41958.1 glycosyltransferase family 2 protein [Prosthecochloris sp. SCSIO W1101]